MRRREIPEGQRGSPYIRISLAMGEPPAGRIRGWVSAMVTNGDDNVPMLELIRRYADALRRECHAAGFKPACDAPLENQSAACCTAAERWRRAVVTEGTY